MTNPTYDHLDPDLVYGWKDTTKEFISVALVNVVARGRLFVLDNNGEYQQVEMASFWKNDNILTVCNDGFEFNEDGDVTRDWREEPENID